MTGFEVKAAKVEVVDVRQRTILATLFEYDVEEQVERDRWQVFARDAFLDALSNPKQVKVSVEHEGRERVVGAVVELRTRPQGLQAAMRVADTTLGRDTLTLMKAQVVDVLAVTFAPVRAARTHRVAGGMLERVEQARLVGVSPVVLGGNSEAAKVLAARDRWRESRRQAELEALEALTAG